MDRDKLPTTKLSRGRVVGKAILKIGVNHTKESIKGVFLSPKQKKESAETTHVKNAKVIMNSLGQLKGVSIKIAQQVALGMPFLPPAYLDEMSRSFQAVPPINKALVRKIVKQELGEYPSEAFGLFELSPFGSASLGQVHYAIYEGENLAIKIQYPGVAKSIKSDIGILKFAIARFAKGKNIDHIIDEISDRLYEEVDYLHEAQNLKYFYQNLNHPHIVVPELIEELSTKMLLATSLIRGINLEQFLASNPPQSLRDHYAQILFDSFFITLYKLKRVHADPNPGNFIFMDNEKLGMIDFGCIKVVDDEFLDSYTTLHLSLMDSVDDEEVVTQYLALDMIDRDSPKKMLKFYQKVIKPLDSIYIEIFLEDNYSFKEHNDFSRRGFEAIMKVQKQQIDSVHKLNQEYIFLDRTLLGYYTIFERMGAAIDTKFAKDMMKRYQRSTK
ncbi:MAG: AarF/ABC1/UbiB kinase family protein [Campylobacterota bacterium]|nr:AarF/ABC1/UbiB kinase family protein [Campylobacterota bacterium]